MDKKYIKACLLNKYFISLLVVFVLTFIFALMVSLRTMPYAEGWYTYYAQLINDGKLPYKDFEYLFPPLYINFVALFCKFFGYSVIYLRVFGAFLFSALGIALYCIFNQVFENKIAVFSALASVFYLQTEVVQIFYDYIRMYDLFIFVSIAFLLSFLHYFNKKNLIFLGMTTAAALLIKQSGGCVFAVFIFIFLFCSCLYFQFPKMEILKILMCYLFSFLSVLCFTSLIMFMHGNLFDFLNLSTSSAVAAKGGVFSILFIWLFNNLNSFVSSMKDALICYFIFIVLFFAYYYLKNRNCFTKIRTSNLIYYFSFSYLFLFLLIFHKSKEAALGFESSYSYISPYFLFDVIAPSFFYLVFYYFNKIRLRVFDRTTFGIYLFNIFTLSAAFFAIAYGVGMSGGLVESQTCLGIGILVGVFFTMLKRLTDLFFSNDTVDAFVSFLLKGILILLLSSVLLSFCAKKMIHTYSWWDMTESHFWRSKHKVTAIPILKGLKLSESTLQVYQGIYDDVMNNTTDCDKMFCFPQIPIFYTICNRKDPGTYSKVQWFDVTSDKTLLQDIEIIKKNCPKIILIYNTEESTYTSHELLFRNGEKSGTRIMKEFLLDFVEEKHYIHVNDYKSENNVLSLYLLKG